MASLTIAGQPRELTLTAKDIAAAEWEIIKLGGPRLMKTLAASDGVYFALEELRLFVWAAWRGTMSADRIQALLDQFYAEGGTIFQLNAEVQNALVESGVLIRRVATNGPGPPPDPPPAGISAP
jgi:hypothetical protein